MKDKTLWGWGGSWHSLVFSLQVLSGLRGFGEDEPLQVCWIAQDRDVKMPELMQAGRVSVTAMKDI